MFFDLLYLVANVLSGYFEESMKYIAIILLILLLPLAGRSQDQSGAGRLEGLIAARDYRQAARIADSLLSAGAADFNSCYFGGLALSNLLDFRKAELLFKKADSIEPGNKAVLFNLSDCYYEMARLPEAEHTIGMIIRNDSTDPAAWIQMAKIKTRQGNSGEAVDIYNRLWQADSSNLWFPRQISNILIRNEQYREACPYLEFLTEKDSSDMESFIRLGQAYLRLGQNGKLPVLDKAIRQDSTVMLLYRFRGGLCLQEGYFPDAETDFQKAISLGDSSAFTFRHLGLSQFYLSRYDRALGSFLATIRLDSTDVQAWYYLGFCYKWNQDVPKAIECLKHAAKIAIPPFTAGIFAGLGQFYSLGRDFQAAILNYEKALEFNPDDPTPHAQLGLLIEESNGNRKQAKDHYEKFLKAYKGDDQNLVRYVENRIQVINERLFMEGNLKK